MKLLYAEDERSLSEAVVDAVYDGQEALDYAENEGSFRTS